MIRKSGRLIPAALVTKYVQKAKMSEMCCATINMTVKWCQIDATVNVMVMCQLPVYIKLTEATCLTSEAIKCFCSEHIKYLKSHSQETENSGTSRNGF